MLGLLGLLGLIGLLGLLGQIGRLTNPTPCFIGVKAGRYLVSAPTFLPAAAASLTLTLVPRRLRQPMHTRQRQKKFRGAHRRRFRR